MSGQASLSRWSPRETLETPDGETRDRAQALGRSPYCRNPSPVPDKPDLDHPRDRCQHCGSQVTEQYRRVLGDQDDIAHSCPHCEDVSQRERFAGRAASTTRDIPGARGPVAATNHGNHP